MRLPTAHEAGALTHNPAPAVDVSPALMPARGEGIGDGGKPGHRSCGQASERLLERAEVGLVGPRRPRLAVNLPVDLGDRIDVQHAVLAALFGDLRSKCAHARAIDAAVDDHVRDMDT